VPITDLFSNLIICGTLSRFVWEVSSQFYIPFAALIILRAGRRRREVLKHEYNSVKVQYLAIQDANARVSFITERVKLVNSRRAVRNFTDIKSIFIDVLCPSTPTYAKNGRIRKRLIAPMRLGV